MEDITMGIFLIIVLVLAFRPVRKQETVVKKSEPVPAKRVKVRRNSPQRPTYWDADDPAWDRVQVIPLEAEKPRRRRW